MVQPVPQQAAAHAGSAVVEEREEGRRRLAAQGLRQLQVATRGCVEAHIFAGALGGDGSDMSERLALRLAGVLEQRAAGADRERQIFDAEAREGAGAELLQEPPLAGLDIEMPGGKAGGEVLVEVHAVRDQHLRRIDAPEFVRERLRRHLRHAQRAARERQPGEAHRALVAREREQDVVGLVIEERRIGERPRRDDARDLPVHRPLGGRHIPDLLADRDRFA